MSRYKFHILICFSVSQCVVTDSSNDLLHFLTLLFLSRGYDVRVPLPVACGLNSLVLYKTKRVYCEEAVVNKEMKLQIPLKAGNVLSLVTISFSRTLLISVV